MIQEMDC